MHGKTGHEDGGLNPRNRINIHGDVSKIQKNAIPRRKKHKNVWGGFIPGVGGGRTRDQTGLDPRRGAAPPDPWGLHQARASRLRTGTVRPRTAACSITGGTPGDRWGGAGGRMQDGPTERDKL